MGDVGPLADLAEGDDVVLAPADGGPVPARGGLWSMTGSTAGRWPHSVGMRTGRDRRRVNRWCLSYIVGWLERAARVGSAQQNLYGGRARRWGDASRVGHGGDEGVDGAAVATVGKYTDALYGNTVPKKRRERKAIEGSAEPDAEQSRRTVFSSDMPARGRHSASGSRWRLYATPPMINDRAAVRCGRRSVAASCMRHHRNT